MPVINCIDLTKDAIFSIRYREGSMVHLIDNASTDGTHEWGNAMNNDTMAGGNIMNYVRNETPKGVAASWNQGIRLAFEDPECKYVAVLNNDILLHEKTLEHLVSFIDKTGYIMVTGDNIKDRMSIDVMVQQELPKEYTDFDLNEISDWRAEGPDFSCFLITRETIDYIGWFDERFEGAYCEDQDYHARINRAWRWGLEHGEPNPAKMHAKRLSTAPYFHYASQTLIRNNDLKHSISTYHGRNQAYYLQKWGAEHPQVMDGEGNATPFGDATKSWKDCERWKRK